MQTLMAAGSAIGQRMMSMVSRWATVMMVMIVMMMMLSPGRRGCCSQPSQLARPAPLQLPVSCTANTRTSRTSQTATATSVRISEYIHPCYSVIYPPCARLGLGVCRCGPVPALHRQLALLVRRARRPRAGHLRQPRRAPRTRVQPAAAQVGHVSRVTRGGVTCHVSRWTDHRPLQLRSHPGGHNGQQCGQWRGHGDSGGDY